MDRAIQESLQGTYRDFVDELFELPPLSETVRQGDKCTLFIDPVPTSADILFQIGQSHYLQPTPP